MLTINASSLRASLGEALANNSAVAAGPGADPAGFASLLRQTQGTAG
ncbi:MAG: hypothetical protein H7138_16670, partial [Myxococcales bacterium]|nr:hypothetical protein [Myxococcales bacterium]